MVSLKDIANKLDVSVSLVSKVLNNKLGTTGATPETIDAIRAAAKDMGYRKNLSALALLHSRHNVIGVYIHKVGIKGSEIFGDLVDGVSELAGARHQNLFLNMFEETADFRRLCTLAHPGVMDGLIIAGMPHGDALTEMLAIGKTGLPVVSIFDDAIHPSIPNVGSDQRTVAGMATRHIIERGSRKICHIKTSDARFEGYCAALKDAGLTYDERLVYTPPDDIIPRRMRYSHEVGTYAVREFLARGIAFDGIVTGSDNQAVACINELVSRGIRVPDDVRVTGIDNAPFCEFTRTTITSVSQEFKPRAELAMELLMRLVDNQPAHSVYIDPVLHIRQSTR